MRFKKGDKVIVKSFSKRPQYWNADGKMDKYMGKVVTIRSIGEYPSYTPIKIEEDHEENFRSGWAWIEKDLLPIPKPGDKVRLRTWEDMEKQYSEYAIDPVLHLSARNCFGKIFTVSEVYDNYFQTKEYHRNFGIKFEAIEEVYPKEEKMEFTKDMLKSGKHVVEYRNGQRRLYLNEYFIGVDKYSSLKYYDNNLKSTYSEEFNIIAVYDVAKNMCFEDILKYSNKLIWKRDEEPIEIPSSEAFAKLKDIYGKEVKIVEDKDD